MNFWRLSRHKLLVKRQAIRAPLVEQEEEEEEEEQQLQPKRNKFQVFLTFCCDCIQFITNRQKVKAEKIQESEDPSLNLTLIPLFGLEMDMMKERFAKLLLGEDMSGGGKGVSSALALSNALTNLAGMPPHATITISHSISSKTLSLDNISYQSCHSFGFWRTEEARANVGGEEGEVEEGGGVARLCYRLHCRIRCLSAGRQGWINDGSKREKI